MKKSISPSFLTAILMTLILVIMSNSPPMKTNFSLNTGMEFSAATAETTASMVMPFETAIYQTSTVMEVADVKKVSSCFVTLTANSQTNNAVKSNTSILNLEIKADAPETTLMRDDRSHILKHPLTSSFCSSVTAIQMDNKG